MKSIKLIIRCASTPGVCNVKKSLVAKSMRGLDAVAAFHESELRAAAGRLALEMMHEIRGPLDALGNFIYLALEDADKPAQVRSYLELAKEQAAHINTIASQTLGLARTSDATNPSDLVAISEAALRIHQHKLKAKRLRLVKDFPDLLVARAHPGELLQVISNLICNAVDALADEGTLFLKLRRRNNQVQLLVADNGQGIQPEHSATIFQPFFTTKGDEGSGLGLALCKKIIERHGGNIKFRTSVRPGKSGTTFKVCIPIEELKEAFESSDPKQLP